MESFIQKQEKLLEAVPSKAPEGEGGREAKETSVQEEMDGLSTPEQGAHPDSGELSPSVLAFLSSIPQQLQHLQVQLEKSSGPALLPVAS